MLEAAFAELEAAARAAHEARGAGEAPSEEEEAQAQMVAQLVSMGFDEAAVARAALERS